MFLIVGLGNPGAQYAKNRHNIGFHFIDALAQYGQFGPEKRRFQSLSYEGTITTDKGPQKALLLKPQTFMNLSGQAVSEAVSFYKLKPDQVIVFHDELDLTPGRFRAKTGGGNAGHNGLKSITAHIGPNFVRGRLGIGHPGDKSLVHHWVLSDFHKADQAWHQSLIEACCREIGLMLSGQTEAYQNAVMALAPAPRFDPRL